MPVSEGGPDQIDVEVGLNLRRMRLARGFSQTELGNALGVSFQQIQKYERGSNRLSASMLVKAARFLAISAADLLPMDDDVKPIPNFIHRFAEVRGVPELVDGYCTLRNPALRSVLLQLVKAMNGKPAAEARPMAGEAAASPPP
ncbi:helix-turn-helix transcriptional regulator [Phenylobacterium montanum]|uniref:Helix-turn-helix transcriptional regulator n=2 Tax=Phenylobacterium montanum TaxID=2823693 RepID=A0A975G6E4_9CAUL|nr:helix-turn-helix transcriptional regulator [Caulobacter sp. S6]